MKYKNILIDLDGTLIDSQAGITKSAQYALGKFNIIVEDLKQLIPFIGPPLKDSFMNMYGFTEPEAMKAIKYYREYFHDHGVFDTLLYPGVEDLLRKLHSEERLLFVATAKPTVYAKQILDEYKLSQFFSFICGANLDGTRTNKSEIIKIIIDEYKINIEDTVMIGDRKYDIIGAHNNKIDSIAVGYGYGTEEELKAANPTQYVKTVEELYLAL